MARSSSARGGHQLSTLSSMVSAVQPPSPKPSESSEPESVQSAVNTPWPGPGFKIGNILPGSVFMWACGESSEGDKMSLVSRSEAAAAWIILSTQATCYAGLWYVSGNQPDQPSSEIGDASEPAADYSIGAIASAMYLILSIAATDVWCGCALILEGRGSGFVLFTQRRVFGVFLLATFLMLVGASIRVLFFSAKDDVQLVLGAAAVLFIADVDEKAMAVLQNISGEWVLFWVLEIVGLSFALAVFAVKITGNTRAVSDHDEANRCATSRNGCDIFSWYSVVSLHPTAVTTLAFLLTSMISRTSSSLAGRILSPRTWKGLVITLFVLGWVAQAPLWLVHPVASTWFESVSGGCALVFILICHWRDMTRVNFSQILRKGISPGGRGLLSSGVILILLKFLLEIVYRPTSSEDLEDATFDKFVNALEILFAALFFVFHLWLINRVRSTDLRAAHLGSNVQLVSFLRPMLLGWCVYEGFFAIKHWFFIHTWKLVEPYPNTYAGILLADDLLSLLQHLIVVISWGESAEARGVGYWISVTLIRTTIVDCVSTWVHAALEKTVK